MSNNERRTIEYKGFDGLWRMDIDFDHKILITKGGEAREYQIPKPITKIEHDTEYVFLYVEGGEFYQLKFEVENAFIGDLFNKDGEHIDTFACHKFGEDE